MMTENGYRTIIVVGGDAALCDALNGIMEQTPHTTQRPALGVIPNGFGNDFAHFWGLNEDNYKQTIDWLMQRRVRRVDVGKAIIESENGTSTHFFLNCISIGVSAAIMGIRRKTHSFLGFNTLSYLCSALWLVFQRMTYHISLQLNSEKHTLKIMNACIGSSSGYGQTPSAIPYNGQLDVTTVSYPQLAQLFYGLQLLFAGRFLKSGSVKSWRTTHIQITNSDRTPIAIDGHCVHFPVKSINTNILPEAIEFLIPQ